MKSEGVRSVYFVIIPTTVGDVPLTFFAKIKQRNGNMKDVDALKRTLTVKVYTCSLPFCL